jgi:Cu(I)/Ag(I) efflux system membrane fusion protein
MKPAPLAALVVLLVAAALGAGYWAGRSHLPGGAAGASATAQPTQPARKPLYYRNPMGLPDTSPVPKKDAMGMDYIPVYAGDAPDDPGVVKVNPERMQTLGVTTAEVTEQTLAATVRAVGRIDVDERAIHDVAPRFDGWIEKLYVSATGDPVRRGQPLFTVYSPEVVSAYKEVAIAKDLEASTAADPTARAQAEHLSAAARERLRNWDMAGGRSGSARVTYSAPVTGVVLDKKAVDGMRFTAGTPLYRIADLSTVWVMADVYEQDLARIRVGQPARVTLDAFPDKTFDAKVAFIYPTLDSATRTTPIRLVLANRDGLLRPGMFAHVDVATGGSAPRLTVPDSAVIDDGDKQVVLLALGDGRFKPQAVKLGLRTENGIEVLDGLAAGDKVVTSANFLIDSESNIRSALAGFAAKPAQAKSAQAKPVHPVYHGRGVLDSVDAEAGLVTISHQPIPVLKWPGMTMDFDLDKPELAKGLKPHEAIRFEFEARGQGEYVVTRIERSGP